jgi:hypothetical protein
VCVCECEYCRSFVCFKICRWACVWQWFVCVCPCVCKCVCSRVRACVYVRACACVRVRACARVRLRAETPKSSSQCCPNLRHIPQARNAGCAPSCGRWRAAGPRLNRWGPAGGLRWGPPVAASQGLVWG